MDVGSLQDYLASKGHKSKPSVTKAPDTVSYKSFLDPKSTTKSVKSAPKSKAASEIASRARMQEVEIDDMVEGVRSVHNEVDYSNNGARQIITSQMTNKSDEERVRLRSKLLRNLECVRKGSSMLPSERSCKTSVASTNARLQMARA